MAMDHHMLKDIWRTRNMVAHALAQCEHQVERALRDATVDDLVALIESFSPGGSTGPDWTRTFEPLVERLWTWRDDTTMAALAERFRARGLPWMAVANALSPEHGQRIRRALRHPARARLPAFAAA